MDKSCLTGLQRSQAYAHLLDQDLSGNLHIPGHAIMRDLPLVTTSPLWHSRSCSAGELSTSWEHLREVNESWGKLKKVDANGFSHRLHISGMQTHNTFYDSSGNWIAFLFGATFNIVTHMIESGPASYLVHAIAGGIVCLGFKLLGDLFTPLVHRLGVRISRWLEGKMFWPWKTS